ncbi:hypothetical protein QCA50_007028 [Cerrena zonata]|uniref:AB hydrolase-1 domain-containing protein n=1 Tax=Cerrena zonata TaxID=2478898 RepID=A0AAW0GBU5_9APHY
MKYSAPLRPFVILAIIISAAEASSSLNELQEPLKEGIEWRDCNIVGPLNASCGHFEVPLDWNDPSAGKGRLAVIKYHATRPAAERKGVLFTHPGGAAGDAMGWLIARSEVMMNLLVNGTYDLVSWDIRGTPTRNEHIMLHEYSTIPSAPRCFPDQAVPNQLWESIYNMKVPTSNITFSHPEQASLYSIIYRLYEYRRLFAKSCTLNSREEYSPMLKYMGTAATTRDLVALADYLQGPGTPINFHGVSKGSLIGSHLINMFPEVYVLDMLFLIDPQNLEITSWTGYMPSQMPTRPSINSRNCVRPVPSNVQF